MHLFWILPFFAIVSAFAIHKRDADFYSVRTKSQNDLSGKRGDVNKKYFRECRGVFASLQREAY
jgi:hypothetical protein